jgi:VanZ family protein
LTLAVVALIIYGSLFPFQFSGSGTIRDAFVYLFATPLISRDRGDVLSNVLLYVPLGLFGARALEKLPAAWRVLVMAIVGGAFSTGIEITQFFDVGRATELSDITSNFSGALTGALVEIVARGRVRRTEGQPFAILLMVSGLGMWLYPYLPSFHLRAGLLAGASSFDALGIFKQTVLWLAAASLVETIAGAARVKIVLPAMAALVLLGRLMIPEAGLAGSDLIGAAAGVLGWLFVLSGTPARAKIAAGLFAAFVIIDAFRPFVFLSSPRQFGWTPFQSFINGPRGYASRVFLEKTFIYGSLLWLFNRSGLAWLAATLSAAGLVLALRIAQMWIPGRSAEITDVLMVLILAGVMKVLSR